jgi:exonuclease SbcC
MIPLKLQLKNFLSYGPEIQVIDFTPYHLICLSGKNGHGKSALLDAMTWAVWGQARKSTVSAKPDATLLHLGQTFMMVSFDFEFNGQIYRIKREFGKTYGKPYAQLEFGLLNIKTNSLIPLTDKTIKKTQQKIEETLRLDFESFVNSAFLRQGAANEFSQKNPKERKEILAIILGLNHYDELRKRALEKVKQAIATKTMHHTISQKMQAELGQQTTIEKQLLDLQKNLHTISQTEHKHIEQKNALETLVNTFRNDQKQYELILFKQEQLATNYSMFLQQLNVAVTTWRTIHRKKINLPSTTALDAQCAHLNALVKQHQHTFQSSLSIKENILQHKEKLHAVSKRLQEDLIKDIQQHTITVERAKVELQNTHTKATELSQQRSVIESEILHNTQEQKRLADLLNTYDDHLKETALLEAIFDKRKTFYQKWAAQGNMINTELGALQQKDTLVHDDQDPSCPLCEQNLSASRKRFLKTKFVGQRHSLMHEMRRIKKVLAALKPLLVAQNEDIKAAQALSAHYTTMNSQIQELQKNGLKLTTELQRITAHTVNIAALTEQLNRQIHTIGLEVQRLELAQKNILLTHKELSDLQAQLTSLEKQAEAIQYNAELHQQTEQELVILDKKRNEIIILQQEMRGQEDRAQVISTLIAQLRILKCNQQQLIQEALAFQQLSLRQRELTQTAHTLSLQTEEIMRSKEILLQEKGKLESLQHKHTQLIAELQQEQAKIIELEQIISDYQAIASATGKDGIQALLIEEAIPEIEQEANLLLAKLTNNQAQLFLESLRDLKGGGTKETLDINISDSVGIRSYEMFSGGEAFRIDFAIRIAISKLLARRAGTALQTLIIDEGFGSQDEEGLGLIMDALYKIQDDFSKIIIVSHLPSMKDQFPVHFIVEKKPQGSIVKVMEQG